MPVSTVPAQTRVTAGPITGNTFLKDTDTLDDVQQGSSTKKLTAAELAALQAEQGYLQHAMREAAFEALAARRREQYAGSGIINFGKQATTAGKTPIQNALHILSSKSGLGWPTSDSVGDIAPSINVNGYRMELRGVNANYAIQNTLLLPPAPNDAAILTRYDLVILEVWHELVSDKDVFYPYGNTQFGMNSFTPPGGSAINLTNTGLFAGQDTYSLFGNWQAAGATVGYGVKWSTLSAANKILLLRDPEQDLYLNNAGQLVQVRYRVRTIQAPEDAAWGGLLSTLDLNSCFYYDASNLVEPKGKKTSIASDFTAEGISYKYLKDYTIVGTAVGQFGNAPQTAVGYLGKCFAIPIALVYRQRNSGIYHEVHNPAGCAAKNEGQADPTSTAECFSIPHDLHPGTIASGATAHPSGFYCDEINAADFTGGVAGDLRNSAHRVWDFERAIRRWALRYLTTADALCHYPSTTGHTPSTDYLAYLVGHDSSQTLLCPPLKRDGNDLTHQSTGATSGNKIGLSLVRVSGKLKLQVCTEPTCGSDDGVIALNSATGKKQVDLGLFVEEDR